MAEGNGFAGRDLLLKQCARRYDVAECDGFEVRIQSLTEREKSQYEGETLNRKGVLQKDRLIDARLRLIVLCAVDGDGKPLFTNADLPELMKLDSAITGAIHDKISKHLKSDPEDIEGLVKNSSSVPVEGSPSA